MISKFVNVIRILKLNLLFSRFRSFSEPTNAITSVGLIKWIFYSFIEDMTAFQILRIAFVSVLSQYIEVLSESE
jgi:hypothetical protein